MFRPKRVSPHIRFTVDKNKNRHKKYECKYCSASFSHIENYELHYEFSHTQSDYCSLFGMCELSPLE